jgi:hypothetical protein
MASPWYRLTGFCGVVCLSAAYNHVRIAPSRATHTSISAGSRPRRPEWLDRPWHG